MGDHAPAGPAPAVTMSPDGRFWWNGWQWVPMGGPLAERKNPAVHLLASMFVPGLGTMIAGRVRRGAIILGSMIGGYFVVMIIFMILMVIAIPSTANTCGRCPSPVEPRPWPFVLFPVIWLACLAAWVFSVVDGYRSAVAWNRAHGWLD